MLSADEFIFLSERRSVKTAEDWNRTDWPLLWLYNLHYFDDLVASESEQRFDWHTELIARWILENPPVSGIGWQSYPLSLRVVNWIKFHLATGGLTTEAQQSLAIQTRFLRRRLEYHLLGNHLWANAKALVFAGCFFDGPETTAWHAKGLSLLQRELKEQILEDGGHFERSPMYHAIVLEDLLDLIQMARIYPTIFPAELINHWQQKAGAMLIWLQNMSHPDGEISFFNDATQGIAPNITAIHRYAALLDLNLTDSTPSSTLLESSGYARMQFNDVALLADVGEIGPDYLPGHAHADTLSFELSLFGHRVLVNQGIDRYGADAERVRQRGTVAHNTVQVDGENSSEVWGGFRVARRANPFGRDWQVDEGRLRLQCSHDGYLRLPGRVTHTRSWELFSVGLTLIDELEGQWQTAVAFFHFHPDVLLLNSSEVSCELEVCGRRVRLTVDNGTVNVKEGQYHPGFGLTQQCVSLEVNFSGNTLITRVEWNN